MKIKRPIITMLTLVAVFKTGLVLAAEPTLTLVFADPNGICKDSGHHTHFSFNYSYEASGGIQYYSGPTAISNALTTIVTPPLPEDGVVHSYSSFKITDQGDCGAMELDYQHPGNCYLTNLIPSNDQLTPYSYVITLTPQPTGNHTYGTDMYNLSCKIKKSGP